MSTRYAQDDLLYDVVRDLRTYTPLVNRLPDRKAIFQSYRTIEDIEHEYPIWIAIQPVYSAPEHQGAATQRTFRVQATLTTEVEWREDQDRTAGTNATIEMGEIMSLVADRMEVACAIPALALLSGGGGGSFQPGDSGRLAIVNDWPYQITQTRD